MPTAKRVFQDCMKLAHGQEKLERGKVWCTVCGRMEKVDVWKCFEQGWPKCCELTMTLDSPRERQPKTV